MSTDAFNSPTGQYYIRNEESFSGIKVVEPDSEPSSGLQAEVIVGRPIEVYCPTVQQLVSNCYSMGATHSDLFNLSGNLWHFPMAAINSLSMKLPHLNPINIFLHPTQSTQRVVKNGSSPGKTVMDNATNIRELCLILARLELGNSSLNTTFLAVLRRQTKVLVGLRKKVWRTLRYDIHSEFSVSSSVPAEDIDARLLFVFLSFSPLNHQPFHQTNSGTFSPLRSDCL